MTVDFFSDSHLEFFRSKTFLAQSPVSAEDYWAGIFAGQQSDTLLMAGDIAATMPADHELFCAFFRMLSERWLRIYWVLGNHDYWREPAAVDEVPALIQRRMAERYPNITVLENGTADLGDVMLFGATWWSPIDQADTVLVEKLVNDYRYICGRRKTAEDIRAEREAVKVSGKASADVSAFLRFNAETSTALHAKSLAALDAALSAHPDRPFLVMTHHAPSFQSNTWPLSPLTQVFCANDDAFIADHPQIRFWLHGHIHGPADYRIGETHVLCNPHGYILKERTLDRPFALGHVSVP